MKIKIITFLKKYYDVIIMISLLIIGVTLLVYGCVNGVPLQHLERDYQIETFGFYDSSIKYLKDVDDSLNYFMAYIGLGLSCLFADVFYCIVCFIDVYHKKLKKNVMKDTNNG